MAGKFEIYEDRAGKFRFRLKAGSVDNPFDLGLLGGFSCPASL